MVRIRSEPERTCQEGLKRPNSAELARSEPEVNLVRIQDGYRNHAKKSIRIIKIPGSTAGRKWCLNGKIKYIL
ncbi:MAG: hypothetical protein ABIA62_06735 [Candidatus Woesearchaeota archaeon]